MERPVGLRQDIAPPGGNQMAAPIFDFPIFDFLGWAVRDLNPRPLARHASALAI